MKGGITRRHIKRRVISMTPSASLTNRGNPKHWRIAYECGHVDEYRPHYGHYPALAGVLSRGYPVEMCCGQCEEVAGHA